MANMSFANNAATTLAASLTNVATSLTVSTGTGTLFPTLTGSQYFYCTLENTAGTSREIVKVTARSTDTFTIVRGQDGTTGTAFASGDKCELRLVRANLTDFALLDEVNTFSQAQTFSAATVHSAGATIGGVTQTGAWVGGRGQVFTSSGTFTVPTGVTAVKVTLIGGGGGSGGNSAAGGLGFGGGGGASAIKFLTSLTSGNTIAVTVGAAGTAGSSSPSNGGAGGNSSIASGTQTITTVTAGGGGAGLFNNGTGGLGGTATSGDINVKGSIASFASQSAGASLMTPGITPQNTAGLGYGAGGGYNPNVSCQSSNMAGYAGSAGIVIFEW